MNDKRDTWRGFLKSPSAWSYNFSNIISSNELNTVVNDSSSMLSVCNIAVLEPRVNRGAYLEEIKNTHDYFCFYWSFH